MRRQLGLLRWLSASERVQRHGFGRARSASRGDALACSWGWTGAWLSHYGEVVPHRFAVGEVDGAPCGIALVTSGVGRRRGPFRVRSVHLGTAGEPPGEGVFVEYNRVLVDAEHRSGFAAALINELRSESDWHELSLDGFAPEEAEPFLVAEPLLEPRRIACSIMNLRDAESGDGNVLTALKSSTRTKVRRSLKALGDVETDGLRPPPTRSRSSLS